MAKSLIPKQRVLTETETQATFECWKEGMEFHISLDPKSSRFLTDLKTWTLAADRGFTDDAVEVAADKTMTTIAKKLLLNIVLGSIASYAPVISPKYIKNQTTCLDDIWTRLRAHFGFRKTGGRITEFCDFRLGQDESRETLWERMYSFLEDNLLTKDGDVLHNGVKVENDEDFTPSLQCILVTQWLHAINSSLPAMVRQRFPTQLRTNTVASLREEISDAIPAMLDELEGRNLDEFGQSGSISRAGGRFQGRQQRFQGNKSVWKSRDSRKSCCLCDASGRKSDDHYIQFCPFLPSKDKKYMSRTRDIVIMDRSDDSDDESNIQEEKSCGSALIKVGQRPPDSGVSRRIQIISSPVLCAEVKGVNTDIVLDCGAEANLITRAKCAEVNAVIKSTNQQAFQADGVTPLDTVGETSFAVDFTHHRFLFCGLVVEKLDSSVIGGMPFLCHNDVFVRPSKRTVYVGDCCDYIYSTRPPKGRATRCTATATILRIPHQTCLLPGEGISFQLPKDLQSEEFVALEPRSISSPVDMPDWLSCGLLPTEDGCVEIRNPSPEPVLIGKHAQIGQVRPVIDPTPCDSPPDIPTVQQVDSGDSFLSAITVDPSGVLTKSQQGSFHHLHRKLSSVFSPGVGTYNGRSGHYEHVINMSSNLPPQRRGRVPMYNRVDLVTLQLKLDELLAEGVLGLPGDCGVSIEYSHPTFLVRKKVGFRVVSSFGEFAEYARVAPTASNDVESVLQRIGQWKVIIKADLKWAYYQILLAKCSMKYVGVVTPFKGTYVYKRSVMGLPGSEAALEEVMSKVLGDLIQDGDVVKLSDDLYCGGQSVDELLPIWGKVLERLSVNGMKLSPDKTVICPTSTIILGWLWENGRIRPTTHRMNALVACDPPSTVKGLRSFIGCFKFMSRVLPAYSDVLSPLDELCAGRNSKEKIVWTDQLTSCFNLAKNHLKEAKPVILPRESDELHIITDASMRRAGVASALYVVRNGKAILAGYFNAKRRGHQMGFLPCEAEALCIAVSIKHFSPYIIQSKHRTRVMTDSKACVQAYRKLCKGEFSLSTRLTTFLSIVSRYGVEVMHIAGKDNIFSDFVSRNPIECEGSCQICDFVEKVEHSVVREVKVSDILSGATRIPYTSRAAWLQVQKDCSDLVKVSDYISQAISPSRKKKGYADIRRYLGIVSRAKSDGLLVVKRPEIFKQSSERIVIPRGASEGLLTALHLQLSHPSKHQLKVVFSRAFYALDMDSIVTKIVDRCYTCAALKNIPAQFHNQSTTAPSKVGSTFSADVMKDSGQCILLLRESISSFTDATLIHDETAATLRDGIITLASRLRSPLSQPAIIRTDPASGLRSLLNNDSLKAFNMSLEIGDEKNINKNPIAEKAIEELRAELVRLQPLGGKISPLTLSRAISNLNGRIRHNKLSAFEVWTQREMSTGDTLKLNDTDLINNKVGQRVKQHASSAKYKARGDTNIKTVAVKKGDIVYLYSDRNKSRSRDKYLVVGVGEDHAFVQKFTGNQLRSRQYRVKRTDLITVPSDQTVPQPSVSETHPPVSPRRSTRQQPEAPVSVSNDLTSSDESEDSDEWNFSSLLPVSATRIQERPRRQVHLPNYLLDYVLEDDLDFTNGLFDESVGSTSSAEEDEEGSENLPSQEDEEHEVEAHTTTGRPKRTVQPPDRYQS